MLGCLVDTEDSLRKIILKSSWSLILFSGHSELETRLLWVNWGPWIPGEKYPASKRQKDILPLFINFWWNIKLSNNATLTSQERQGDVPSKVCKLCFVIFWLLDYFSSWEIRRLIPFWPCYWHSFCLGRLCSHMQEAVRAVGLNPDRVTFKGGSLTEW